MDPKVKGSWLVHHTNKLQGVVNQGGFENTFVAGKCGILLSAISSSSQHTLSHEKLAVLAQSANINTVFELPKLLEALKERALVDVGNAGIAVLGVTNSSILQHTSEIFEGLRPSMKETAALQLAEYASARPIGVSDAVNLLGNQFQLDSDITTQVLSDAEQIGFVDVEEVNSNEKLFFNGNLFRRDTTQKIAAVLNSLSFEEQARLHELTGALRSKACLTVERAKEIAGELLFSKITSVGLVDVNVVSNSTEEIGFVTLPSAFSKYSNSLVDDAFDLAKAFVNSISYGITRSSHPRGQIRMVDALLGALIRGEWVGPVRAIAEDYKVLELKGVVEVQNGMKKGRYGPMLRLLKPEVGELALQAIQQGDVSEHSLLSLPTAAVTRFSGPESNRERARRKQTKASPKATNDMLSVLRTGGGF